MWLEVLPWMVMSLSLLMFLWAVLRAWRPSIRFLAGKAWRHGAGPETGTNESSEETPATPDVMSVTPEVLPVTDDAPERTTPRRPVKGKLPHAKEAALAKTPGNLKILGMVILAVLLLDALVYGIAYVTNAVNLAEDSFADILRMLFRSDSLHYVNIAQNGYQAAGEDAVLLVFFPLYPQLIGLLNYIVGDYFISALIISHVCIIAACFFLYKLFAMDLGLGGGRAVGFLLLFPAAFFLVAAFSESLFLLLIITCCYAARKKLWVLSAALGMLAAYTRILGIVVLVFVIAEAVRDSGFILLCRQKKPGKGVARLLKRCWAPLVLIPLGLGLYFYVNYSVAGDPFKFFEYQREHWGQSMGFFGLTVRTSAQQALTVNDQLFTMWLPQLIGIFFALISMILAPRKLRLSYVLFMLVYFVCAISPTWLLSAPRYLMCMFPMYMILSVNIKKPVYIALYSVISLFYLTAMTTAFSIGMHVY